MHVIRHRARTNLSRPRRGALIGLAGATMMLAALTSGAYGASATVTKAAKAPKTSAESSALPASVRFRVQFMGSGKFDRTASITGHIPCAPGLVATELDHAAFRWDFTWEVTIHPRLADDNPVIVPQVGSLDGQAVHNLTGPDSAEIIGGGCSPHDASCTDTIPFRALIGDLDQSTRQKGALVNRALSVVRAVNKQGVTEYLFAATVNPDRSSLTGDSIGVDDRGGCQFEVDGVGPLGLHDYGNPYYYSEQDNLTSKFRDPLAPQPFVIPARDLSTFGLQELPVSSRALKPGDVAAAPGAVYDCGTELPGAGSVTCTMGQTWDGRVRITKLR